MRLTQLWRARPLGLAIIATIGAAGLVLYLQYRAIATLESQTEVIVRQISEQAADDIAAELRRTLAGPVLETMIRGVEYRDRPGHAWRGAVLWPRWPVRA